MAGDFINTPCLTCLILSKLKGHLIYVRLSGYHLEEDIRYCMTPDSANVLPVYQETD